MFCAAVIDALHTAHADAKVSHAERLTSGDGEMSYELSYKSGGHEHEMTVSPAGDVLEQDEDGEDAAADDEDDG